jgi:hypothetical protein
VSEGYTGHVMANVMMPVTSAAVSPQRTLSQVHTLLNISKTRVGAAQDDPQGPLRVYPGGLSITRSVGNAEASESIIAVPDVSITAVPVEGARLVLASDGLWNALGNTCVGAVCKQHPSIAACVDSLMEVSTVFPKHGCTHVLVTRWPGVTLSGQRSPWKLKARGGSTRLWAIHRRYCYDVVFMMTLR